MKMKLLRYVETSVTTHLSSRRHMSKVPVLKHNAITTSKCSCFFTAVKQVPPQHCDIIFLVSVLCSRSTVFCVFWKQPCNRCRLWTCDLWQPFTTLSVLTQNYAQVSVRPVHTYYSHFFWPLVDPLPYIIWHRCAWDFDVR
jgi:hypothetical protein